jgi:hypothetical protein
MFSMREVHYKPEGADAQSWLRFGNNTLVLMKSTRPGGMPYVDHFALEIEDYDDAQVQAELKRRGLTPQLDDKLAWSIQGPEGMRVKIVGKASPA